MNVLTENIGDAIKNAIEEYSQRISTKYESVDPEGLEQLWNDVSDNMKISVTFKRSIKKNIIRKKSDEDDSDVEKCPYVITKGQHKGDICSAKPKEDMTYCGRHTKYEGIDQKPKKTLPQAKKSVKVAASKEATSKKPASPELLDRTLHKRKDLGVLWHSQTGLVFKSSSQRIVVGRIKDDEVANLSEEDIDLCKKWSFGYIDPKNQDEDEEKIPPPSNTKGIKRITKAIDCTQIQGSDVEDILGLLQNEDQFEKKNITKETENNETSEEEYEEYEEYEEEEV